MLPEVVPGPSAPDIPAAKPPERPSRLIRLPEVIKRVSLSRSSIYKKMSEGRFPRSRPLGPKCAVWVESEIDRWINMVAGFENSDHRSELEHLAFDERQMMKVCRKS
jgi:prophage regulatory protein